jgi:DMSO reductase iron-sulfur subunit
MGNKNIKKSLLLDVDLCVGCFACEVACKQEHNLPVGRRWIRVVKVGPKKVGGKLFMHFVPVHCRHCGKPPCIDVCPVGAISKRSDGIVLSNEELCIGCKICMEACPFGALQYNPEKEVIEACNLCVERVDKGLEPICVQNCPTGALRFGDTTEFVLQRQKRGVKSLIEHDESI